MAKYQDLFAILVVNDVCVLLMFAVLYYERWEKIFGFSQEKQNDITNPFSFDDEKIYYPYIILKINVITPIIKKS